MLQKKDFESPRITLKNILATSAVKISEYAQCNAQMTVPSCIDRFKIQWAQNIFGHLGYT